MLVTWLGKLQPTCYLVGFGFGFWLVLIFSLTSFNWLKV
jgi:hypothetical protein